ncbi:MAG: (2Fe-2S)-binding protein [Desulfobacterales bacterium]|nr:(2Fe-2S)-binding protein [Deltaproteobacteria bacterium]NNK93172.1 (2Fe-2S)-binding protein [Desulfobacterales bacterium]
MLSLHVNGKKQQVYVAPDTPLLWVLRDNLEITSVKYACGIAECGVCTVLIDGEAVRSCSVSLQSVQGSKITTIEGLPADHPVKLAWIEKQVPQCGYCQPGIMLQTVDFLSRQADPSEAQINEALDNILCRCGSHPRIKKAIKMVADMTKE